MTNHVDRFHGALTVLTGHGHIKQRLIKAYEEYLAEIEDDELPVAVREAFADLRHAMHKVRPSNGEGPICASVRKMSIDEAGECTARMTELFLDIVRMSEDTQTSLPLAEIDETRVPPFLLKSV